MVDRVFGCFHYMYDWLFGQFGHSAGWWVVWSVSSWFVGALGRDTQEEALSVVVCAIGYLFDWLSLFDRLLVCSFAYSVFWPSGCLAG